MTSKEYKIYRCDSDRFADALRGFISQASASGLQPIRFVVFCDVASNDEYLSCRDEMRRIFDDSFGSEQPLTALVAQAPLDCRFAAEVTFVGRGCGIKYCGDYILLNNEQLLTGAICGSLSDSIAAQADCVCTRLGNVLSAEGFVLEDIMRQWNFIEKITQMSPEGQNYQQFNDARSRFYGSAKWSGGYPAATGIGTAAGGVVVMVDAVRDGVYKSHAVDNPLQISAHAYSQQVLINNDKAQHKTTPKFERARWVSCGDSSMVYVSGTAAIRGEQSCQEDLMQQTRFTMENIDFLVSPDNLATQAGVDGGKYGYSLFRIYLKYRDNWEQIYGWIKENYDCDNVLCVEADICRQELLVEIESIVNKID